jgi:ketosteroid isomerase-like protein
MRKLIAILLLAAPLLAQSNAAEEVRQAEIAFAKAFADRDSAKFFSYVLDDATFLSRRGTLSGKAEVIRVWSDFFKPEKPPFSWRPERVVVNGAGDLGLSTGPVRDPEGKHIGDFASVWQKQKDGSWKIVFDGPGSGPPCK